MNLWREDKDVWVHLAEQRSHSWKEGRIRPTTSKFTTILGKNSSDEQEKYIASLFNPTVAISFDDDSIRRIEHGEQTEPLAREWYAKTYKFEISGYGLIVPKFDIRIGGSPDGLVYDQSMPLDMRHGLVEFKCPEKPYFKLDEYLVQLNDGWKPPPYYHDHIFDSHYDQMQGMMAITKRPWCDYVVFCNVHPYNTVYVERIPFNKSHWNDLYRQLCIVMKEKLSSLQIEIPGKGLVSIADIGDNYSFAPYPY